MKVLCIDDKIRPSDYPDTPEVKEGNIYLVICTCNGFGADGSVAVCYRLEGFGDSYAFACDRFIPLSDISESKMKRNYEFNKQKVELNYK